MIIQRPSLLVSSPEPLFRESTKRFAAMFQRSAAARAVLFLVRPLTDDYFVPGRTAGGLWYLRLPACVARLRPQHTALLSISRSRTLQKIWTGRGLCATLQLGTDCAYSDKDRPETHWRLSITTRSCFKTEGELIAPSGAAVA